MTAPGWRPEVPRPMFDAMAMPAPDTESDAWVRDLGGAGPARDAAVARLHAYLLRIARAECARRQGSLPDRGREEVDHLVVQAVNDAVLTILRKLGEFRGAARFTTWAAKFVIFELSTRLRRHTWRHRRVERDEAVWDSLADARRPPLAELQHTELMTILERLIRESLTERQRLVFRAAAIEEVPIDVLAERLGTTRGAIYKALHDARARLRRGLRDAGYEGLVT